MVDRKDVYAAIDTERDYQVTRWKDSPTRGVDHSVMEFVAFMRSYVEEALEHMSRNGDPEASAHALHLVRKATALGVACMERHGAPPRG